MNFSVKADEQMNLPKIGCRVKVEYTLRLKSGTCLGPQRGEDEVEFILGTGAVLPGVEQAVMKMAPGESRVVKLPPALAFGSHRLEKLYRIERKRIPAQAEPLTDGDAVRVSCPVEGEFFALVRDVDESGALVDANHPLAGQEVTFDIRLLECSDPSAGEGKLAAVEDPYRIPAREGCLAPET